MTAKSTKVASYPKRFYVPANVKALGSYAALIINAMYAEFARRGKAGALLLAMLPLFTGCAAIEQRPVLRSALFIGAGVLVAGVVAHEGGNPAPQTPFPAPRPPAPFNPCSGSNLCAK